MVQLEAHTDAGAPIQVRNLYKSFHRGTETIEVLKDLSLEIQRGEFVAFMGPSGSGKSTLLNLIGGLDRPDHGEIEIDGSDITTFSESELTRWRSCHVGFIFQMFNLIPVLTAFQNVELPLLLTQMNRRQRKAQVELALELVGLSDRMAHFPNQLSGGQEQRVGIARALVTDPTFLLCDEPTGDLDRQSANDILTLLEHLSRDHQKTILMVTHDPLAAERAQTTLHLDKGVLVEAIRKPS
jgi:putative ABC transport system ATP-binding protein